MFEYQKIFGYAKKDFSAVILANFDTNLKVRNLVI